MEEKIKDKLLETFISITVLTAICFGIAYLSQVSYLKYYKLPYMFVQLNIDTITRNLLNEWFLLVPSFILIRYFVISMFLYFLKDEINNFGLFTLISPRFKERLKSFYQQKLQKYRVLIYLSVITGLSFFLWVMIEKSNESIASSQTDYMVLQQKDGPYVVVTNYDDLMVIAPVSLETSTITPNFKTIEIKDLKGEMVNFNNGLKVADLKNSQKLLKLGQR